MKQSLLLAGLAAAAQEQGPLTLPDHPVWGLRSVLDHRTDQRTINMFGDHATGMANARPPLRSHLMTFDDEEPEEQPKKAHKRHHKRHAEPAAEEAPKKAHKRHAAPADEEAAPKKAHKRHAAPAEEEAAPKKAHKRHAAPAEEEAAPKKAHKRHAAPADEEAAPKKAHKKHNKPAEEEKKALAQASDDDSTDSDEDLMVGDEVDHSGEFFKAADSGQLHGGGYHRVTTSRFAADDDDIFMRSMIEQYALEGKNKDGSPNGQFWLDEAGARAAASEVVHTHKGMVGSVRDNYLKTYFPRTWAHFDVNRTGKVEAIKMPQFMRFLCSDQQMYLW